MNTRFARRSGATEDIELSKTSSELRTWGVQDSIELYQVQNWGSEYFSVRGDGQITVHPDGPTGPKVGLLDLVRDLEKRGYDLPVLLRFSDVLRNRVTTLCGGFRNAIDGYGYRGVYRPVYPIKVNQQRDVVEELVEFGRDLNLGLEAGSKPEVLVALAHMDNPEGLIVCNGYKDNGYVETVMLAQKLGRHAIIVIDRFEELETVIKVSRRLDMRPHLGRAGRGARSPCGSRVRTGQRGSGCG